jgi:hypothetical protein
MRDREVIDSELRLIAAVRRSIREHGATVRMRSNCGMITTSTLSRLSWGDVGVDALDALSCPVNEPPVRVAQR